MKKLGIGTALVLALVTGGCKQADGPVPDATAPSRVEDLSDIGKDLMAIQSGDKNAPQDFVDDVSRLAPAKDAEPATIALATQVANAAKGAKLLTMPDAVSLSSLVFQTVAGREVSRSQAKAMREEVKRLLTQAGVTDPAAVLQQMEATSKAVSLRPAKWYELF
jgi:hypothetical protein